MFTSPQTITINAVGKDCNRITSDKMSSMYATDDGDFSFKISHQINSNRSRRMARIDQTVVAADPLTAVNTYQKAGVYIVVDEPNFGFTTGEIEDLIEGLKAWLTTSNITALLASRH